MTTSPSDPPPNERSTLADAKAWLRARLDKGARCPCCTQRAQTYKRKVTASMVRTAALVLKRQEAGSDWVYLPDIPQHSRDFSTLAFFGLVEQKPGKRPDGGAAGWWRVTPVGRTFLEGQATIQKYAKVFDGRALGYEGEEITVRTIVPEFRLDELLAGV